GADTSVHEQVLPRLLNLPEHPSHVLLMQLRDEALLQLDGLKREKGLNKATDAEIVYHLSEADRQQLEPYGVDLADVAGAGSHSITDATQTRVEVLDRREDYALCARSRKR